MAGQELVLLLPDLQILHIHLATSNTSSLLPDITAVTVVTTTTTQPVCCLHGIGPR